VIHFENLQHALTYGYSETPSCIAYRKGKGWLVYSPFDGCPKDAVPELFLHSRGHLPTPLSVEGGEALLSLLFSLLANGVDK
jgi:hypothetical protein